MKKRNTKRWVALALCICIFAGVISGLAVQGEDLPESAAREDEVSAVTEIADKSEAPEEQDAPEDGALPEEGGNTVEEESVPQNEDEMKQEQNYIDAQDEPLAHSDGVSGDLGDFLDSVEILDENGNLVEAKDIKEGQEYKFRLRFKEPESGIPTFGPATKEQFEAAGIPESEWKDGGWMFGELAGGIGVLDYLSSSDKVKFYTDPESGKTYILVKYEGEETYAYDIEFDGQIKKTNEDGSIDVFVSEENGTYTPPDGTSPYMKKEAYKYDPDTHHIKYKITITNPTDDDIAGFDFKDSFSTRGYENLFPKLVDDSVTVDDAKVSSDKIGKSEQGKFSFTYDKTIPKHGSVVVEYELDVTELVEQLGDEAASFLVENESSVTPEKGGTGPLTDDADYRVDFGKLEKTGWKRETGNEGFYGYDPVIEWQIEAYDPYKSLGDSKFTDKLPAKLEFGDIIGVRFETDDGDVWFVKGHDGDGRPAWNDLLKFMTKDETTGEVIFDFSQAPENLKNLFKDNNHRLKMHVLTTLQNIKDAEERKGNYRNEVETTLPSEEKERSDYRDVNIGDTGITSQKDGVVAEGGKKLNYEVNVTVEAGIADKKNVPWRIGAGLVDRMHIIGDDNKNVYIDTSDAITVTSVTASYGESKSWEFTEKGEADHRFGVYSVASVGTQDDGYLINNNDWKLSNHYTYLTAIVLNPQITRVYDKFYYPYEFKRVHGTWPEELDKQKVTLTYKYSIDPTKAYFVDMDSTSSTRNQRIKVEGASTLAEYLNIKGDVRVYNSAVSGIKDSQSTADEELDLSLPLTKEGHLEVDPVSGKKTITYAVEFQNGLDNSSSLPKDATNILFYDTFDNRLQYIPDSLNAECIMPDGTKETFDYRGGNPCSNHTINAAWVSFMNGSENLEVNFRSQTGHYRYVFTYKLEPIISMMPDNKSRVEVNNTATVKYQYNGTEQNLGNVTSTLYVPTGALTKQAVLENGKVSFYVEINENEEQLSENGILKVEDSVSDSPYFDLDYDNILVQKYENGNWVKLDDKDWKKSFDKNNKKLTLELPDQTHLRVWYAYSLSEEGKKEGNVQITNTVTVNGIATLNDGGTWGFATNDLGEDTEEGNAILNISKTDQNTGDPLSGATFLLYVVNIGQHQKDPETIAAVEEANRIQKPNFEYTYKNRKLQ